MPLIKSRYRAIERKRFKTDVREKKTSFEATYAKAVQKKKNRYSFLFFYSENKKECGKWSTSLPAYLNIELLLYPYYSWIMAETHGRPSEGMSCMSCWEDIDSDLYVEYKTSAGSVL